MIGTENNPECFKMTLGEKRKSKDISFGKNEMRERMFLDKFDDEDVQLEE